MPLYRQLTLNQETNTKRQPLATSATQSVSQDVSPRIEGHDDDGSDMCTEDASAETIAEVTSLIENFVGRNAEDRTDHVHGRSKKEGISKEKQGLMKKLGKESAEDNTHGEENDTLFDETQEAAFGAARIAVPVLDFNQRVAEQEALKGGSGGGFLAASATNHHISDGSEIQSLSSSSMTRASLSRLPFKRSAAEIATITIGEKTILSSIGTTSSKKQRVERRLSNSVSGGKPTKFCSSLRAFAAPGTRNVDESGNADNEDDGDSESRSGSESGQELERELEDTPANSNDVRASSSDDGVGDKCHTGQTLLRSQEESGDDSLEEVEDRAQEDTDEDYLDEADNRAYEEAKVAQLIQRAEEDAARPSQENEERAKRLLRGRVRKESTVQLVQAVNVATPDIAKLLDKLAEGVGICVETAYAGDKETADLTTGQESAEQYLSLTIVKDDFARMRVVGQFNLGFILVTRPATHTDGNNKAQNKDEVFIIDQHASDEKYNFERLQSETTVQNQPLVKPHLLDLTAMEEEVILAHLPALEKNGFLIEIDSSGDAPVGKRCRLVSLPMSREVVFNTRDLEELITLLAESPPPSSMSTLHIPRPSKVRRMFAMRACRSSVMVGRTLTARQMGRIVTHMGEIDKPWNCPHGRPTMRHLIGLDAWRGWAEGDGIAGLSEQAPVDDADDDDDDETETDTFWARYVEKAKLKARRRDQRAWPQQQHPPNATVPDAGP